MVDHPDVLVAFNRPSLEKFAPAVRKGGVIIYDSMAGQFQGPEGVKVISVPATEIATEHGAIQAANTAIFGAREKPEILACPKRPAAMPSRLNFAKKPMLIPKNLEILEAGAGAVRVQAMAARK